jgi:predicted transcriptional regulator of viral defense system
MAQVVLKKKDLPAVDQAYAESVGISPQEWKAIVEAMGRFPNEFEIAMVLVDKGCISFYSAYHYHGLTDQLPKIVFVSVPYNKTAPLEKNKRKLVIKGVEYRFIQSTKEFFFGHEQVWINNAKRITITDLERTLLDGLRFPHLCGGFQEVLHAFQLSLNKMDKEKIVTYAGKMEAAVAKRLGYVLEKLDVEIKYLEPLLNISTTGYNKLDPTRQKKGVHNKKWMIIENA